MARIYVSSTYQDLQTHREQVERLIRRMGHEDVAMEYYVAEDRRPVAKCLADVTACDVYVGIFAWRYGWQPKENNPENFSITEMEYRQAIRSKIPCLIFLLDGKADWPPDFVDEDLTPIRRLRGDLGERHLVAYFRSDDDLGREVAEAIYLWEKKQTNAPVRRYLSYSQPPSIFICYAKEDEKTARELYLRLKECGHKPWIDKEDLYAGEEWEPAIRRALRASNFLIICLSNTATSKRGYIQKEIRMALEIAEEMPPGAIFLIPVRLEVCNVPDSIAKYQYVDLFESDGFQRIIRAVSFELDKNYNGQQIPTDTGAT